MIENTLVRFNEFLKFRGDECFVLDYGHGVLPFKTLCSIYGDRYFVVLESNQKLKVFYFNGSRPKFEKRCELLMETISIKYFTINAQCPNLRVWTLGYVPALLTKDFSESELYDALRKDFFKYGHKAYDTGDNLLGEICNADLSSFNCSAYNKARFLDIDFSKWILRQRKMILNRLRKETEDL